MLYYHEPAITRILPLAYNLVILTINMDQPLHFSEKGNFASFTIFIIRFLYQISPSTLHVNQLMWAQKRGGFQRRAATG
jgi:hypothetical protein